VCDVTVLQIHVTQGRGDVLIFMPGQQEIEAVVELLNERTKGFGTKLGTHSEKCLVPCLRIVSLAVR